MTDTIEIKPGHHVIFRRLDNMHGRDMMTRDCAHHLAGEISCIAFIVECDIVNHPTLVPQFFGIMAHRGEDEGNFRRMMGYTACLFHHLHHQNDSIFSVSLP